MLAHLDFPKLFFDKWVIDDDVLDMILSTMIDKGTSKNVKFPLAYHTPPKNQGDFAKKCMNLS